MAPSAVRDPRLPEPGTTLRRGEHAVLIGPDSFAYNNQQFRSLSAVARHITGHAENGFRFFGLLKQGAQESAAQTDPAPKSSYVTMAEMPKTQEPPEGEWVKMGDPRGIRALPVGAGFGLMGGIKAGSRTYPGTLVKVGTANSKTGAITIWIYEGRPARTAEERGNSSYGMYFYYLPVSINGEDVTRLERSARIGAIHAKAKNEIGSKIT